MNVHIATAGEKSPVEAAFNFTDILGNIDKLYIVTGEGFKDKFNDIDSKVETKVIEVNAFNFEAVINCLVGIYLSEKPNIGKNDKIFMNLIEITTDQDNAKIKVIKATEAGKVMMRFIQ